MVFVDDADAILAAMPAEQSNKILRQMEEFGGHLVVDEDGRLLIETEQEFTPEPVDHNPSEPISVVYWLHAIGTDRVKIGYTSDPISRFARLATGSPYPLHLLGVMPTGYRSLETHFHQYFADQRVCGEWFVFNEQQRREWVEALSEYMEVLGRVSVRLSGRFVTVEGF